MDTIPKISIKIMQAEEIHFCLNGDFRSGHAIKELDGNFTAFIKGNQLMIKNEKFEFLEEKQIVLKPTHINSDYFELKDVIIGIDFHWEQKENQRFQGDLKLMIKDDKIIVINILDVENYLKSVISSEMRADSSMELLQAHAVISRSWLFAQIVKQNKLGKTKNLRNEIYENEYIRWYDRDDHQLFDVCADDHCQRYQGISRLHNPKVITAINYTTGLVLKSEGEICDTRYSKCCGGASESFENVWEPIEHSYLQKVIDKPVSSDIRSIDLRVEQNSIDWIKSKPEAFCNTGNTEILSQVLNDYDQSSEHFYRWKLEYNQNELAELVKSKSGIDFGEIIDLEPVERGVSGRLIKLKIIGTLKTLIVGKELEIRRWLSTSHLYSSAFIVDKENIVNKIPQKFVLTGAGWGHGVGLCQIGAAVMGHLNYSYIEILKHYFKNSELEKIY